MTCLIERLSQTHRLRHREVQLAHRLLLQRRSGKRRRRRTMTWLMRHRCEGESRFFATLKKSKHLFFGSKTMIQLRFKRSLLPIQRHTHKLCCQAITRCWHKLLYLTLTLYNQAHSHRLHTTCTQTSNDLFPQHR